MSHVNVTRHAKQRAGERLGDRAAALSIAAKIRRGEFRSANGNRVTVVLDGRKFTCVLGGGGTLVTMYERRADRKRWAVGRVESEARDGR